MWQLCRTGPALAETSLDNYFGLGHDIRDTAYITIDLKDSPICYSTSSVNAMVKMDESCLYKETFFFRVISANIVEIKGMITGQIYSNLTLILSRNLSRRRIIA